MAGKGLASFNKSNTNTGLTTSMRGFPAVGGERVFEVLEFILSQVQPLFFDAVDFLLRLVQDKKKQHFSIFNLPHLAVFCTSAIMDLGLEGFKMTHLLTSMWYSDLFMQIHIENMKRS